MGVRIALATLALALACTAPAAAVETGINETLGHTKPLPRTAGELGADWVRLWALWQDMEPSPGAYNQDLISAMNGRIAALKERGVKVLVVVHRAPAWASGRAGAPPANPVAFGRFMGQIAQRAPGADAWELWNEPDSAQFWGAPPDPAAYAAHLRAAYPAIKAVQPSDVVVTGGMVGNDMEFLAALYANGAQGSFDAVGVHTDTACLTSGPDAYYRDERGRVGRYTFSAYREVHAVMTDNGDGAKPVWMTELGWNTQRGRCNVGVKAGTKRLGVSPRRQARFLGAAYRCVAADPFLGVAIWFGLQDIKATRHARGFGLYRRSGKAKPAARAFRRLARGIRPRRGCGGYVDRTPPTIRVHKPLDGARFRGKLSVRVSASDNRGGSGIGRISMALDGRHVRSWGGSGGSISPWWGSADWTTGIHTLTFSVRDRAQNPATVSVSVQKLGRR
jgi:Cellulase (glycosyl hydrolase family 5)/Bacterial Ig domain